jgi:hypothetical protein
MNERTVSRASLAASVPHVFRNVRLLGAWFFALGWLLAACSPSPAADFCAGTDMNQVVWKPGFERAVHAYFGEERADFFWPDGLIWEQAIAGLGGPPEPLKRLSEGLAIGSACRAHSCPERAAVVIQCPSRPVAFAIKHFRCSSSRGGADCDTTATFTIFTEPAAPGLAKQQLEAWARSESPDVRVTPRMEYRVPAPNRRAGGDGNGQDSTRPSSAP